MSIYSYMLKHVGRVFLCFSRLPDNWTPVPKHVGADTMNCILWRAFYCIYSVHMSGDISNTKLNAKQIKAKQTHPKLDSKPWTSVKPNEVSPWQNGAGNNCKYRHFGI